MDTPCPKDGLASGQQSIDQQEKKMPSFKHILFPIDFSEQNCGIAPYVGCMASRYWARDNVARDGITGRSLSGMVGICRRMAGIR